MRSCWWDALQLQHRAARWLGSCALVVGLAKLTGAQQTCGAENHYRWKEKVEASGKASSVIKTTIAEMLDAWEHPAITKKKADYCVERSGRELQRYSVEGYLWRVKLSDEDDDYHLELTASKSAFAKRCLIAEVPSGSWGPGYAKVRAALDKILGGAVED